MAVYVVMILFRFNGVITVIWMLLVVLGWEPWLSILLVWFRLWFDSVVILAC